MIDFTHSNCEKEHDEKEKKKKKQKRKGRKKGNEVLEQPKVEEESEGWTDVGREAGGKQAKQGKGHDPPAIQ